jgi:hypothetical protein
LGVKRVLRHLTVHRGHPVHSRCKHIRLLVLHVRLVDHLVHHFKFLILPIFLNKPSIHLIRHLTKSSALNLRAHPHSKWVRDVTEPKDTVIWHYLRIRIESRETNELVVVHFISNVQIVILRIILVYFLISW